MALEPYWSDDTVQLWLGDCLNVLKSMPDASVDAVVTDPPAGISFMGKTWDADRGGRNQWVSWLTDVMREVRRVLKPGGHALVWALPRTSHWTATALEDAGFTIRDCVIHIFGSGFPKSLDVSAAIDKTAGAVREVIGDRSRPDGGRRDRTKGGSPATSLAGSADGCLNTNGAMSVLTVPATEEAARWSGWGTSLKPGQEHWWLVRSPLDGTVVANVLEFGTGAINIDATRVEAGSRPLRLSDRTNGNDVYGDGLHGSYAAGETTQGRWPTNLVFSHSASCVEGGPCDQVSCPVAELDRQSGHLHGAGFAQPPQEKWGGQEESRTVYSPAYRKSSGARRGDSGGASRFFPTFRYEAKAPSSERPKLADGTAWPTVKPVDLMRWLVRLITPPGGTVLDPFAGTGTTAEAAIVEGFDCVLIDSDPAAAELIKQRLSKPLQPTLFGEEATNGA